MEKGGGDWGSMIAESEGECSGRVMAEREGEWIVEEWTGVVRRWVWKT